MSHTPLPQAWWHAPIAGPGLQAQPWLAPWNEPHAYAELLAAFADPGLYNLACGLGEAPSADYLRRVMSDPADVHLWRLPSATSGGSLTPLLAHSVYTGHHRLGIWAPSADEVAEDVWSAVIAAATAVVFRQEADAAHVFVHLGLPTLVWQEAFLLRAGFDPFEVDAAFNPLPRELYGLSRESYAELQAADDEP